MSEGGLKQLWHELSKNRFGLVGFGLSLLQLVFHGAWLAFAHYLEGSGQAETLTEDSWESWTIVLLMIAGTVTTMIALFVSLYGSIHGKPKVLAFIGLALSFFVGMFTTFLLLAAWLAHHS